MSPILGIPAVPLKTLPGWPAAPNPPALEILFAFFGLPLLLMAVLAALVYGPALARGARNQVRGSGAVWLGPAPSRKALGVDRADQVSGVSQPPSREATGAADRAAWFTPAETEHLDDALHNAQAQSGLNYSVFVGHPEGDSRSFAEGLVSSQSDPARSVVLVVDPDSWGIEIATGEQAARQISDSDCALAAAEIQRSADDGSLSGGIVDALNMLGNTARQIPVLHRDTEFPVES